MVSPALPCVFRENVLCSFRKSKKVLIMDRCFKCSYYAEFERDMEEEEETFFNYVDELNELTAKFKRGELSEAEYEAAFSELDMKYRKRGWG